ncbi:LGFP repeat-containing protein [Amycolatopsis sp. NPDC059657]|uniref:LGFP repeat-containing protein n=1 Tax=Amycolatopsis sp. NPDC059657 TaxID=3346899 RepID=UPI0036731F30
MWAADKSGARPFDSAEDFEQDAVWRADAVAPEASSPVSLRWLNDDGVRAQVGNPTAVEQADGSSVYRKYERGALFWNAESGVYKIGNEILSSFLQLGGNTTRFKYPVRDEFSTNSGNFCAWFKGGSFSYNPSTGQTTNSMFRCSAVG